MVSHLLFLLKSKGRSCGWLPLALFGPFGFVVLALLDEAAPAAGDWYRRFLRRLNRVLRVAYELCFFAAACTAAYQIMVLKRNLVIAYASATTGVSTALIVSRQNASAGMWAFGEGLEVLYLLVLLYLLWPAGINAAHRLRGFSR